MSGIFARTGRLLGNLAIGEDMLSLQGCGHETYGSLNDSRILKESSKKRFADRVFPLVSLIVSKLSARNGGEVSLWHPTGSSLMEQLIQDLSRNPDIKFQVFDMKPDEIQENKPRDIQAASDVDVESGMETYSKAISRFAEVVFETKDLADVIMRTKLPQKMWGRKDVEKVFADIRSNIQDFSPDMEKFEISVEDSEKGSHYILSALEHRSRPDMVKKVARRVIDDFVNIKSTMSKMAQALHPLFKIDGVFKKSTGYPVTWFVDNSVFYDFTEGYDNLVGNLVQAARIESNVMGPFIVWKVKATGDQDVR